MGSQMVIIYLRFSEKSHAQVLLGWPTSEDVLSILDFGFSNIFGKDSPLKERKKSGCVVSEPG